MSGPANETASMIADKAMIETTIPEKEFDIAHDCAERIYLIGFMGSGKTTVAHVLAERLGYVAIDLDEMIIEREGLSVKEIFEQRGERAFRALETQVLKESASVERAVISTGGGIVMADENRALLNRLGAVVYLQVTAGEAVARIGDTDSRPMLAGSSATLAATALLKARKSLYAAVGDITVDTMSFNPAQVAEEIESKVRVCE